MECMPNPAKEATHNTPPDDLRMSGGCDVAAVGGEVHVRSNTIGLQPKSRSRRYVFQSWG